MQILDRTLAELTAEARALAAGPRRILGITGPPGAGKSTLAAALAASLGPELAVVIPMDGFHLANRVLAAMGARDRKGAPDTFDDAGYAALLGRLRTARTLRQGPGRCAGLGTGIGSGQRRTGGSACGQSRRRHPPLRA